MISKSFLVILIFSFLQVFAQTKKGSKNTVKNAATTSLYTEQQVENSNDIKVIANFIKFNPDNPKTPEFKRKLVSLLTNGTSNTTSSVATSPTSTKNISTISKSNTGNVKQQSNTSTIPKKSYLTPSKNQTESEKILNHLFNPDPNSNEVYISIKNSSKCLLSVKIKGKKSYTLNVPIGEKKYVMIEKGAYNVTTDICNNPYTESKFFNQDSEMRFGNEPIVDQIKTNTPSSKKPVSSKKRRRR